MTVKTRIGKSFLKIIEESFPLVTHCTGNSGEAKLFLCSKHEVLDGHVETYLGASQMWKTMYTTGHARDERDPAYRHATTRAEYIWQLKDEGKTYSESWRIIDRASRYNPITKRCNLCLKEKVYIIFHRNLASLNKRIVAEFYQPCLHRFQTFLAKA